MGASDDEEEYVKYGKPLHEELESVAGQYKKEVQDRAVTKALPVWQQEVTDEQGRRRLHGAFTGGYSAGYFNTVGSKEGWAPSQFTSSRDQRDDSKKQSAEDFMDEDELEELDRGKVQTRVGFDTFGHAALESERWNARLDQRDRLGFSGAQLADIIAPVPDSVGIRLLQKMGWRQGKGIGQGNKRAAEKGSRWGAMASLGAENVQVFRLGKKDDTHGLGFDPFKGAEDFRSAKRQRDAPEQKEKPVKRARGVAFGTGIMDEDDVFGLADDYVVEADKREGFDFELHSDEENEPLPRWQSGGAAYKLPGKEEALKIQSKEDSQPKYDLLPGFVKATQAVQLQFFPPPKLPHDFKPFHTFPPELEPGQQTVGNEPQLPPGNVLRAIKTLAPFVARMGPAFEALAIQKNAGHPDFSFLTRGEGHAYYRWSVRALKAAARDDSGLAIGQRTRPLTAGDRGVLLGEVEMPEMAAPAGGQQEAAEAAAAAPIAEGDRQALQETLQSTFASAKKQDMTVEGSGPPEMYGLRPGKAANPQLAHSEAAQKLLSAATGRFVSSGAVLEPEPQEGGLSRPKPKPQTLEKKAPELRQPKRSVVEWRPAPLLCKRFNVPDPFRGKPAYQEPRTQSKLDSLTLPQTNAANAALATRPISHMMPSAAKPQQEQVLALPPPPPRNLDGPGNQALPATQNPLQSSAAANEAAQLKAGQSAQALDLADELLASMLGPNATGASAPSASAAAPAPEKPINLFKAIFEDDSDSDDEETPDSAEAKQDAPQASGSPQPRSPGPGSVQLDGNPAVTNDHQPHNRENGGHDRHAGILPVIEDKALGPAAVKLLDSYDRSKIEASKDASQRDAEGQLVLPSREDIMKSLNSRFKDKRKGEGKNSEAGVLSTKNAEIEGLDKVDTDTGRGMEKSREKDMEKSRKKDRHKSKDKKKDSKKKSKKSKKEKKERRISAGKTRVSYSSGSEE